MYLRNKISKFTLLAVLTLSLGMIDVHTPKIPAQQYMSNNLQGLLQLSRQSISFNQVYASGDILAANGGTMAQQIRFLYMLINGPGSNGYPTGLSGPDDGLLGLIRQITGPDALGGGLANGGYTVCSDIPSAGETSMTDASGTYRMVFATPVKTVPSGYTGAGNAFDKRVVIQFDGTTFMNIEFNCDANVGWIRFNEPGSSPARNIEAYWDTESNSAAKLELYMHYEAGLGSSWGNEYFVAKFATEANNKYKFFITRSVDKTGTSDDEGFRAAAYGDTSSNAVNAYVLFVSNITDTTTNHSDNSSIGTGDVTCLDVSTPASIVASTACGSLALDSSAGAPIIDAGDGFTISWVADTTNGMKGDITALVDP